MHSIQVVASILLGSASLVYASPASPSPTPGSGLTVSTTSQCGTISGVQYTCQGSGFGNCCSSSGWCGSKSAYCGTGCQSSFGSCGTTTKSSTAKVVSTLSTAKSSATSVPPNSSAPAPTPSSIAPDAPNGTAPPVCGPSANQLIQNPSFESGASSWTLSGGASVMTNGQDTTWYLSGSNGQKYMQLVSTQANTTSSVNQEIPFIPYQTGTIAFDWWYGMTGPSGGLPTGTCTLNATLSGGADSPYGLWWYSVGGWTRVSRNSGQGHVEFSLQHGLRAGNLTFEFSCDPVPNNTSGGNAGLFAVALDNVLFRYCK